MTPRSLAILILIAAVSAVAGAVRWRNAVKLARWLKWACVHWLDRRRRA